MSIEWAVGLFEGEGSIFRDKRCSTWTLQLRMTDRDIVQRFADVLGCGTAVHDESNQPRRIRTGRKACYRWTCSRRADVIKVLELFLPHFGQRRAYTALNCLDSYDEHRLDRQSKTNARRNSRA